MRVGTAQENSIFLLWCSLTIPCGPSTQAEWVAEAKTTRLEELEFAKESDPSSACAESEFRVSGAPDVSARGVIVHTDKVLLGQPSLQLAPHAQLLVPCRTTLPIGIKWIA